MEAFHKKKFEMHIHIKTKNKKSICQIHRKPDGKNSDTLNLEIFLNGDPPTKKSYLKQNVIKRKLMYEIYGTFIDDFQYTKQTQQFSPHSIASHSAARPTWSDL